MNEDSFDEWLDTFFASYYERRPVNATFAGVHEYDAQLPDYSEEGVQDALNDIERLQAEVEQFYPSDLTDPQRLDRRLATGALNIQQWELRGDHFHESNPCLYTGEAIFGVFSLFLTDYAPLDERVDAALSRIRAIPQFLETACDNLSAVPKHWVWRAQNELQAARDFFDEDIHQLIADENIEDNALLDASQKAVGAFEAFENHLSSIEKTEDHSAGEDALKLVVKQGHFREESLDTIRAIGREHLNDAKEALENGLAQFDAKTPAEALAQLKEHHPTSDEYYDRHTELREECRKVVDGRFVDWPNYSLEFVPRPKWIRRAAQNLYFLFYRAPAPHDSIEPVEYLLEPVDSTMDEAIQQERLRQWNTSQIKLNHVIHHGGVGHHLQNYWAYNHADSRIGEMAAVDTALRISLCCGGTMAEGWASYISEQMVETDFLTPLEEYSLYQTRRRMAARAVVDVNLHREEMTADEAINFYQEEANMDKASARYEVAKNSMFPGMALMYILGNQTIYDTRADIQEALGEDFDVQSFHEEFLSSGSVPVSLKAQQLRRKYVE